jgi:hypothetical protein
MRAKIDVRYIVSKPGKDGATRYFWQPAKALRDLGWRAERLLNPSGKPCENELEAAAAAKILNDQLDAWRRGEVAAPELAVASKPGSMSAVIQSYRASPRFLTKKTTTRRGYEQCLAVIEAWAGDMPVRAITAGLVEKFYFSMQPRIPAKANAVIRVLRIVLEHARRLDLITVNPASKPGLIGTEPRLRIWTLAEVDHMVATADRLGKFSLADAILIAYDSGQRESDVLHMSKIRYQGGRLKVRQRKTGALIDVPLTPRLQARMVQIYARHEAMNRDHRDAAIELRAKRGHNGPPELVDDLDLPTLVICESTLRPYKPDHFRHEIAATRAVAAATMPSQIDAWFMDLRDTAVTRLAEAGCTVPEIASITGHTEESVYKILKHYLALNADMATHAIAKLVAYEDEKRKLAEAAELAEQEQA